MSRVLRPRSRNPEAVSESRREMTPPVKRMRGMKYPVISLVDCKRLTKIVHSHPPSAKLFNNRQMSDVSIKVGDFSFFAHKVILSAGSEVFAKMFQPEWPESSLKEVVLVEDLDGQIIFEKFLKYFYYGRTVVQRDAMFSLFLLSDKYNVEALYNDCVSKLEEGLAVALEKEELGKDHDPECKAYCCRTPSVPMETTEEITDDSSESDTSSNATEISKTVKLLIPSHIFPISTVVRILSIVNNQKIYDAALYNLEMRLAGQILSENYRIWENLDASILLKILSDNHFYCKEFVLFKAVKVWLNANEESLSGEEVKTILSKIRFGVMSASELYDAESDLFLVKYPESVNCVREAIRFKLFKSCARAMAKENWSGEQFTPRSPKTVETVVKNNKKET